MKVAAITCFLLLGGLEFWVRHRAFQFLRYKGPSRIQANRALTHLQSEHYSPEGERWLNWLRLITFLWMLSFPPAFWALTSWLL